MQIADKTAAPCRAKSLRHTPKKASTKTEFPVVIGTFHDRKYEKDNCCHTLPCSSAKHADAPDEPKDKTRNS